MTMPGVRNQPSELKIEIFSHHEHFNSYTVIPLLQDMASMNTLRFHMVFVSA